MIRLIGVFKLIKSAALFLVAIGVFTGAVRHLIDETQPSNHHLRELLAKVSNTSPRTLELIGAATLFYAALFFVEGVGLLAKKTWAEYFTTIITASFIPLEVYEMVERESWLKGAVIAVNVAIIIYLAIRLKHDGRWPFHARRNGPDGEPVKPREAAPS